mgnify:CR=1 FL=1
MSNKITICNLALSLIGQEPITSIDDPQTNIEQICALQYPLMRDAVLSEAEWSFAVVRYHWTTPDPVPPVWGFSYRHLIPNEVLRVTYCSDNTSEQTYNVDFKWVVEGNYILSDSNSIYVRGVSYVNTESDFSSLFVQALSARLAMELSVLITDNQQLHASMTNLYLAKMQGAVTMDSMQGKSRKIRTGLVRGSRGGN